MTIGELMRIHARPWRWDLVEYGSGARAVVYDGEGGYVCAVAILVVDFVVESVNAAELDEDMELAGLI